MSEVCVSCLADSVRMVSEYVARNQSVAQGTCAVTRGAEQPQTVAAIIRCSKAAPLPLTDSDRDLLLDLVVLLRYASAHLQVVFNEEGRGDFQSLAQAAIQAELTRRFADQDAITPIPQRISRTVAPAD